MKKTMVFNYRVLFIDRGGKFNFSILTLDKALSCKSYQKILDNMKLSNPDLVDIIIAPATVSEMDYDPTIQDSFEAIDALASCISCQFTEKEAKELLEEAVKQIESITNNKDDGGKYVN